MRDNRYGRNYNNNGNISPMTISLLINVLQNWEYLKPITIFLLVVNIMVHVDPNLIASSTWFSSLSSFIGGGGVIKENCLKVSSILNYYNRYNNLPLRRIFLWHIIHVDDYHLYYNMLSLIYKGMKLENSMGSFDFLILIIYSFLACSFFTFMLYYCSNDVGICCVGFSSILFCLKFILNQRYSETSTSIGGLLIPTQYAAWLELLMIQIITPHASFMGHLSGIISGWFYLKYVSPFLYRYVINSSSSSSSSSRGQPRFYGSGYAR